MDIIFDKLVIYVEFDSRKYTVQAAFKLAQEISEDRIMDYSTGPCKIDGEDTTVHKISFREKKKYMYKDTPFKGLIKKVPVAYMLYEFRRMDGIIVCLQNGKQDMGGLDVPNDVIYTTECAERDDTSDDLSCLTSSRIMKSVRRC